MADLARIPKALPDDMPPPMMAGAMPSAPPDMGPPPAPMVSRIPTQGEQNIAHDEAKLQKVQWHQDNPWGTPENHPGKLGKVAHAFSTLGNIAGNIVAPGVMANIPQTQLGMKAEEGQLAKRVQQEQTAEGENQQREAQTRKTDVDTGLEPGKAASLEAEQGAQTKNLESEASERGTDLAHAYAHRVNQVLKENGDPATDPTVMHLQDAITGLQKPAAAKGAEHVSIIGPDGKTPIMANYDPATRQTTDASGKVITNPVPYTPPNYASVLPMMLQTKTATYIDPATGLPTDMQWNPQTKTYDRPLGLSASNAYGHEAAQAGAVERAGTELINELQANKQNLGTLGAWVQSHGLNTPIADPKLAGIQAKISSFAALNPAMHGARGAQAMKHFEDVVGGLQKNPDATIAAIQGIMSTAHNINPNTPLPSGGNTPAGGGGAPTPKQWNPKSGRYE